MDKHNSISHVNQPDQQDKPHIPDDPSLVSRCISAHMTSGDLDLYDKTARIKKPGFTAATKPPNRTGTRIGALSKHSRRRLRFIATNAGDVLCAQFLLTYHDRGPKDGRELKRQLKVFLDAMRRHFPDLHYLWIIEFQQRGIPHIHLFLNLPATDTEAADFMAYTWTRIVDFGNAALLDFHRQGNFRPWDMKRGSYLCKYVDNKQKCIPENFTKVGRFWGHSSGLIQAPENISLVDLDKESGWQTVDKDGNCIDKFQPSIHVARTLGRYHERQNRRSFFRRCPHRTRSVLTGAPIVRRLLEHIEQQQKPAGSFPLNAHIANGAGTLFSLSGHGTACQMRRGWCSRWRKVIGTIFRGKTR